ncbi:MAG: SCO family protein [Acidobacteria bacterium]|nr:SCO family protein [Acidobacteriota bacterium]
MNSSCSKVYSFFGRYRKVCFALSLTLFTVHCSLFTTHAQKSEHYNSPLYSPRTYDPSISEGSGLPETLKKVGIEQKLGDQLPLDTQFKDESGDLVKLGSYFNSGRPVIIAFVYYECPMLCNQVLNGLTGSLKGVTFDAGKEFDVVAISFDSKEFDKPGLAESKKASYMHPKDLKFAVMESAESKVGNAAEQFLLYCYHYDPSTGKYGFAILKVMLWAELPPFLSMGLMGFVFWRRNKRKLVDSEQ